MKKYGMLAVLLAVITISTAFWVRSQGSTKSKTPTLTTDDVGGGASAQGQVRVSSKDDGVKSETHATQSLFQDGPRAVTYADVYQNGPTTVVLANPGTVPPVPPGYASFNGLVYDVKTEAVVSGPNKVLFNVPTVAETTVFGNLRILHLEKDSLDPDRLRWFDRTILSTDTPAPDFAARTLCAKVELLGKFVLASGNQPLPPNPPKNELAITGSASPDPVRADDNLTYTLTVNNNPSQPATAVVTKSILSPYVDFVSATVSQGSSKGAYDTIVCNLGTLNARTSATISLTVKTTANGLQLRAKGIRISSTTVVGGDEFDTDLTNNNVTTSTTLLPDIPMVPRR